MHYRLLFSLFLFCSTFPALLLGNLWTVSGKIAYFSPTSSDLKKTYGNAFINYELEVTRALFCNWEIWADLDYYTKNGHLPKTHQSSDLQVLPLSLGIGYNWQICRNIYLNAGAGASYTYTHIHHYSPHKNDLTKWGFGGVVKTGLKYYFDCGMFVDLFINYFYQHFNHHYEVYSAEPSSDNLVATPILSSQTSNPGIVHHRKRKPALNVGGTRIGLGIGYVF